MTRGFRSSSSTVTISERRASIPIGDELNGEPVGVAVDEEPRQKIRLPVEDAVGVVVREERAPALE